MALSAISRMCACYASASTPLASAHRRRPRRMAPPTLRTEAGPQDSAALQLAPPPAAAATTPATPQQPLRVLYLSSGTPRKLDMAACLQQLATAWTLDLKTECVDIKRSAKHDLSLPHRSARATSTGLPLRSSMLCCFRLHALVSRGPLGLTSRDHDQFAAMNTLVVWRC